MTIIVVGAGLAGGTAVTELREQGYDGRLVLIGSEPHPPYERPPLSKGYLLGNDPIADAFVHDAAWYAEHDVDLRLATTVTGLDLAAQRDRRGGDAGVRPAAAGDGLDAAAVPAGRGVGHADRVPAQHRGQRPTEGGVRRRSQDRRGRCGLDRARGDGSGPGGGVRGDRLRAGRAAAARGARSRGRPGVRRSASRSRRRSPARGAGEGRGPAQPRTSWWSASASRPRPSSPSRPGSRSTTGCWSMRSCAPRTPPCTRSATSPTMIIRCSVGGSGSSTGRRRSSRARRPPTTWSAVRRRTSGCPTSSPTSTTWAWSTSAASVRHGYDRVDIDGDLGAAFRAYWVKDGHGRRRDARQRLGRLRRDPGEHRHDPLTRPLG